MSDNRVPDRVIDQLRGNLRAAGVPATESDFQGIIEKGFLSRIVDVERLLSGTAVEQVPDYLADWGEERVAGATPPVRLEEDNDWMPESNPPSLRNTARKLRAGSLSPVELVEQALQAIAARDPELNAFQQVLAERAHAAARRAETELAAGTYRGPLHGIPLAVKDLLAMRDTRTTAGSRIHAERVTDFDATAVERLEAAGAIIVGKTRLSEFAYSPGSNNAHYGPTRNPHDPTRDSGGSSSGSGAAVAAGLVFGALGSDTGGSIRIPAALCGIVGLKPTFGRISLHGATTLSWSLDHLGPMARTVGDAALLLDVLAAHDPRDPRTRPVPAPSALAQVDAGVKGLRIGVVTADGSGKPLGTDATLLTWQRGLQELQRQGAELIELALPEMEHLRLLNGAVLAVEAAAYHLPHLRTRLDDYGEFMRHRILAAFAYSPGAFVLAQQARASLRLRCNALFERVDLLSTPTQPDVAPPLGTPAWLIHTGPFNLLGWPAVSVPTGTAGGLPVGLQLIGKPWDEATVLRAARAVEVALGT